ncbi:MAG: radical SAM protein [Myxococcales bacterium]|nr:radical SAM protein [Myxococcales bacterium]
MADVAMPTALDPHRAAPARPSAGNEPERQIEVQLGHLCNNRCVFCVSGQLSEQRRAPQLPPEPIRRQIAEARAGGATKITFLGGEPTLQRSFLDLLALAVDLDFAEIVIFTNGVMTPRETFRARARAILDGLGPAMRRRVIWRFSLQGGTEAAHDATTLTPGSWERIVRSLVVLHDDGARLTGNLCVVASNYESVAELADVAARFSFENLHLDMVRPRDAGDRDDAWLRAILAPYSAMVPAFTALSERVDARLGPGFDLNFGNLPYCVAPQLAHRIHHDGQQTLTVAADGRGQTQDGFDKYLDKRSDKHKPADCARCVFTSKCSGVFDKYREFYGDAEFRPVTPAALWDLDAAGHHFALLMAPAVEALVDQGRARLVRTDERAGEIEIGHPATPDLPVGVRGSNGAAPWRLVLTRAGADRAPSTAVSTVAGAKVAASVVHAWPAESAGLAELIGVVRALAEAVDDPRLMQAADTLDAAGIVGRKDQADTAAARQTAMRHIAALADRLGRIPLAGMRPVGVHRAPQADGFVVRFAGQGGTLALTVAVALERGATASPWRPRFAHEAHGLAPETVAAFSRALGLHLRQLGGSISPLAGRTALDAPAP